VVGYFDPPYAAHVRRLDEICRGGEPVTVVIANPADPILPLRARAEMIAGLAMVDYVIEAGDDIERVLAHAAQEAVIDERSNDEMRCNKLAAHVALRHRKT
jgi:hypothetical protein